VPQQKYSPQCGLFYIGRMLQSSLSDDGFIKVRPQNRAICGTPAACYQAVLLSFSQDQHVKYLRSGA
jgi:hypothetical protein